MADRKRLYGKELYEYLLELRDVLAARGAKDLSEAVAFASRFSVGSMSELFGEAREALKIVATKHGGVLSEQELVELRDKIDGINAEFDLIGGA